MVGSSRLLASALAVVAALALSACGVDAGDLEDEDSPVARYDWRARDGGRDALLEGTLELRDGCLYVAGIPDSDVEPPATLAVFPRALTAWDAEREVLTYAGVEFKLGDRIAAGGGWVSPPESADIPDACEPDEWGDVMLIQDESITYDG